MWLLATFQPITLITLRPSNATSSGGRTLLVPTPYTIKIALLDAVIRTQGLAAAEDYWEWIRGLRLALRPPERAVVNNLFTRILKPTRGDAKDSDGSNDLSVRNKGAFTRTIGYREYVHYAGSMTLGFEITQQHLAKSLQSLLPHITYFGKRGGIVQFIPPAKEETLLPPTFTLLEEKPDIYHIDCQLQMLDDCESDTSFEQVNVFTDTKVVRRQFLAVVPYRLTRSSRSFSDYKRFDGS